MGRVSTLHWHWCQLCEIFDRTLTSFLRAWICISTAQQCLCQFIYLQFCDSSQQLRTSISEWAHAALPFIAVTTCFGPFIEHCLDGCIVLQAGTLLGCQKFRSACISLTLPGIRHNQTSWQAGKHTDSQGEHCPTCSSKTSDVIVRPSCACFALRAPRMTPPTPGRSSTHLHAWQVRRATDLHQ